MRRATSAASPTSTLSWNRRALVTRPPLTSKQAIAAETDDLAGQPAEAVDVPLGAVLEQHLQADADAEERQALVAHGAVEMLGPAPLAQRGHRDVGRPDAREDEAVDVSGFVRG